MRTVLTLLAAFFRLAATAQIPDMIIHHAAVYTLDEAGPKAQAIAITGGKITKVGSDKQILALKGKKTILLDAKGQCVIPGIFDSHLHVIRAGRFYNAELRWDGVRSLRSALAMLAEQAKRTPKGQWVRVVGGWNAFQFEEKRLPTLDEINAATGEVPTFILHLYGHAYLNKAGLAALGIDGQTANPPGGLFEKDPEGNPTGLLVAKPNAYILYSTLARLPDLSEDEKINSTMAFMRELNRFGITAAMDAGGGFQNYPDDYATTQALCAKNALTIRLPHYLFAQKAGREYADYAQWIRTVSIGTTCHDDHDQAPASHDGKRPEYHVRGGGENLVMSAADFENFDQPRPTLSPEMEQQLTEVLSLLIQNRWPFRLHATYDESITRFLDVIEKIDKTSPVKGLPWIIDHAETVSEKNLLRIRQLGGGIAVQHRMAYQGESFIRRYGRKATAETPPIRRMLELGIPVGMGSDGTRVASYNPFVGLHWLTTGKTIGGTMHMSRNNLLDRTEAIRLYTQGSASLAGMDGDIGMIKEGFLADLAILSDNYFEVPEDRIPGIESILTLLNGRIVYANGEFRHLDPKIPDIMPHWSPVKHFGGYQNSR